MREASVYDFLHGAKEVIRAEERERHITRQATTPDYLFEAVNRNHEGNTRDDGSEGTPDIGGRKHRNTAQGARDSRSGKNNGWIAKSIAIIANIARVCQQRKAGEKRGSMKNWKSILFVAFVTVLAIVTVTTKVTGENTQTMATMAAPEVNAEAVLLTQRAELPEPVNETKTGLTITPSGNVYTDDIPLTNGYQCYAQDTCRQYDVPYALVLGMIEVESDFVEDAWSGCAYGWMQINPINYDWLRELGIDPEIPSGNIRAGVLMIGDLLDRYEDVHKALMAYNCGETGAAELWEDGYESSSYSRKVIAAANRWNELLYGEPLYSDDMEGT